MGGVRVSGPRFYLLHEGLDSRLRGNDGREKEPFSVTPAKAGVYRAASLKPALSLPSDGFTAPLFRPDIW